MRDVFDEVLATFENEDIRRFADKCIDKIDPWFWIAPAASSGRYHPKTSLGDGGLARHTISVIRFLNYILEPESVNKQFTSRERDLMRLAALFHDSKKSGDQADYEKSKFTKFDHPLLAARFIRSLNDGDLPDEDIEMCASIIETHMGQFNTSSKSSVVLPKPENKYQILVHICDYVASRRDVEVRTDMLPEYKDEDTMARMPKDTPTTLPTIENYRFDFGKHLGMTIPEIAEVDPGYIKWAKKNMTKEPARTLLNSYKI